MNYYSEAVDIIFLLDGNERLTRDFLIQLLKSCPGAICKASKKVPELNIDKEKKFFEYLKNLSCTRKIQAIKEYREYSGKSLLDAKQFIESL